MCNLVLHPFFFSDSKAKSSGIFVEKFDAFSRFSMVVSSITCTVRRDRSKEVKTQVKKSRKEWRVSRARSSSLCTKEETKKKSKKNQFEPIRWRTSLFYLLSPSCRFSFSFFFFGSIIIEYRFLCTCFVLLVSSLFFFFLSLLFPRFFSLSRGITDRRRSRGV